MQPLLRPPLSARKINLSAQSLKEWHVDHVFTDGFAASSNSKWLVNFIKKAEMHRFCTFVMLLFQRCCYRKMTSWPRVIHDCRKAAECGAKLKTPDVLRMGEHKAAEAAQPLWQNWILTNLNLNFGFVFLQWSEDMWILLEETPDGRDGITYCERQTNNSWRPWIQTFGDRKKRSCWPFRPPAFVDVSRGAENIQRPASLLRNE